MRPAQDVIFGWISKLQTPTNKHTRKTRRKGERRLNGKETEGKMLTTAIWTMDVGVSGVGIDKMTAG